MDECHKIREFPGGATRTDDTERLDYEGFLSPLVLRRYARYMHKHRKQANGELRDSNNWQKGIPLKEYMKSKWRHFMNTWLCIRKHKTTFDIEESLCGEMFNTMGILHEILSEPKGFTYTQAKKLQEKGIIDES